MDILKDVLPAVDNLQLALANAKDSAEDPFVKGVQLVYDTLLKSLKEHGAEPFDSVGKELDPEKMEAIATLPSDKVEEGKVSNEVKRGWMLRDRLLRAAQVVVSSGKANG
jgi:molecular chaperone GrpE